MQRCTWVWEGCAHYVVCVQNCTPLSNAIVMTANTAAIIGNYPRDELRIENIAWAGLQPSSAQSDESGADTVMPPRTVTMLQCWICGGGICWSRHAHVLPGPCLGSSHHPSWLARAHLLTSA